MDFTFPTTWTPIVTHRLCWSREENRRTKKQKKKNKKKDLRIPSFRFVLFPSGQLRRKWMDFFLFLFFKSFLPRSPNSGGCCCSFNKVHSITTSRRCLNSWKQSSFSIFFFVSSARQQQDSWIGMIDPCCDASFPPPPFHRKKGRAVASVFHV